MPTEKPFVDECYDHVVIDSDGAVTVEQHGYTEGRCKDSSKHLENSLGIVRSRRDKDDPGGGTYQPVA